MDRIKKYIAEGREIEARGLAAWKSGDYAADCVLVFEDHAIGNHARLLDALEWAVTAMHNSAVDGAWDDDLARIAAILKGEKCR